MTTTFRNTTATVSVELVTETCCNCGVVFAMTTEFNKRCRKTGQTFYCPAGHAQIYTESEAQKVRRELQAAEQRLAAEQGWTRRLQGDLDSERKSHASTKGQLTKTRNRANAGVCLDCNRSFVDVARHRRDKHGGPDAATGKRVV